MTHLHAVNSADYSGDVICLPGVYLTTPDSCLPVGPSTVLTQMAKDGMVYPAPSLPVSKPSISLNEIPYQYAKITSPSAPLYGSPAQADGACAAFTLPAQPAIFLIALSTQTDVGLYYQSSSGLWVDGGDVARASPPVFQGVVVHETPRTQFGWISDATAVHRATPDFSCT